jgi:hypothetical protein
MAFGNAIIEVKIIPLTASLGQFFGRRPTGKPLRRTSGIAKRWNRSSKLESVLIEGLSCERQQQPRRSFIPDVEDG